MKAKFKKGDTVYLWIDNKFKNPLKVMGVGEQEQDVMYDVDYRGLLFRGISENWLVDKVAKMDNPIEWRYGTKTTIKLKDLLKIVSGVTVYHGKKKIGFYTYTEQSYPKHMLKYMDYYVEWAWNQADGEFCCRVQKSVYLPNE